VEIVFERRYRGPLASANGGYASGRLAQLVDAPGVEVTLRRPPPLERPLRVRESDGGVTLLDGDAMVADAQPAEVMLEPPPVVSVAEAADAARRHVRTGSEVFSECFTCGIRAEHDGLEIYAGPVARREPLHAAPWTPHEVRPEVVWAAIDCPGAYAVGVEGRGEIVLGRMAARVDRLPAEGEACVVLSWPLGADGRKLYAGTALLTPDGELLAIARQTWIQPRAS
jgi:hypothetical protein